MTLPRPHDAYTYMGLLDDAVDRYPWRFKVDAERLHHLLAVELINGKPILLNDGYLVNNDYIRSALMRRDGLLWELMRNGFVRVMSRGGDAYGLQELPERMADRIPTFANVVQRRVPGLVWKDLRQVLHQADDQLRADGHIIPWPHLDAGSGFLALVDNLRERRVSPHFLGIGGQVGKTAFTTLLDEVSGRLHADLHAARTVWEEVVLKHAANPDSTNAPQRFASALMNLANEMYHYNMGILLSASFGASVSVQTQTSAAFDDLLVPPNQRFLLEEVPTLPRLQVPMAVTQVDPLKLASIVRPGSAVFDARQRWVAARDAWELATPAARAAMTAELRDAGDEYARRLAQFVGAQIKFKETEELVEYVLGEGLKWGAGAAAGAALTAAGATPAMVGAGTLGGLALGYAVTRARKKALGSVFKKIRIQILDPYFKLSPRMIEASERALRVIKRRQVPSVIQIAPSVVQIMAPRLKPFQPQA